MSVYKKIALVMQDVHYLQKDDQVAFGNTKYKAISEEKVTAAVREALVKHGVVIIPVKQEHKKVDNLSTVDVTYKIVDVDTGDSIEAVSSGTGADTQDKGVGKAMTYAYKYLLLRTFAIPTGEDPDKISSAELDAKQVINPKPIEHYIPLDTGDRTSSKPITQKQVGLIKTLALELVDLGISKKDSFSLMQLEVGDFKELTDLTAERASRCITKLNELKAQQGTKTKIGNSDDLIKDSGTTSMKAAGIM